MKLGEFFIDLVVDSSKGELTVSNLVGKMGELEAATVGEIGVLVELANKMAGFTDSAIKASLGLKDYNTITGGNTMELQKWMRVAEHVQVSGDAVTSTFKSLSASIAEMQMTGKGKLLPLAERLGLNLGGKDAGQILDAIRKSQEFQKLPNAQKTLLLGEVGIDPMLARVLELTSKQFNDIGNQFAGISEKGQKQFFKMSTMLTDISHAAHQVGIDIAEWNAGGMLKTLQMVLNTLNAIQDWFNEWKRDSDTRNKSFHKLAKPFSKEFNETSKDIFDFIKSGEAFPKEKYVPGKDHMFDLMTGYTPEGRLKSERPAATEKVEVHNHISFNGVQTPEAIRRAAETVFTTEWSKKLIQNGQVLSSGEVIA
jgi:hypothetical protein